MEEPIYISVNIGEVKVAGKGHALKAILGSCVGIAILWRAKGIFGLAHCFLPERGSSSATLGARFVSDAVPSLLKLLEAEVRDHRHLEAVVVGAGNMTKPNARPDEKLIGDLNAEAAKKYLEQAKIRIIHVEVGGKIGRRIVINCSNGSYFVDEIARMS